MAAPNTRDWRARENNHAMGCQLIVSGEVEVTNLSKGPHLAGTDSHDPKVLVLELTILGHGDGADVMAWKRADFIDSVTHNEFDTVVIRWEGEVIERITVIDDREHGEQMGEQTKANNAAARDLEPSAPVKKPKEPAAKKPATKKPAAKKAEPAPAPAAKKPAAKKVVKKTKKKTAKKAAKKSAKKKSAKKKSAKKAAKKATKKSTLKRLVKKPVRKFAPGKKKKSKKRR